MNLVHGESLADSHAAALAAAGPDLPLAARVVLGLVLALALLSAAARCRRPSSSSKD
ncbi:hypothetical protein [Streptomyces sp. NPDC048442]|uniref:hypothetical protein n=1 Tax=Streptomyces sp. NPDC048442 TaxID=3154823 RepID=UPI003413404C